MDKNKMKFAMAALRRASYKWPARYNTLKTARVGRNEYQCAKCGSGKIHKKNEIQIDHIHPVMPVTGWDNWEGYIDRMFADEGEFQVLCKKHHKEKSITENAVRRKTSKKRTK